MVDGLSWPTHVPCNQLSVLIQHAARTPCSATLQALVIMCELFVVLTVCSSHTHQMFGTWVKLTRSQPKTARLLWLRLHSAQTPREIFGRQALAQIAISAVFLYRLVFGRLNASQGSNRLLCPSLPLLSEWSHPELCTRPVRRRRRVAVL